MIGLFHRTDRNRKCDCRHDKLFVTWHRKLGTKVAFREKKSPQKEVSHAGGSMSLHRLCEKLDTRDPWITQMHVSILTQLLDGWDWTSLKTPSPMEILTRFEMGITSDKFPLAFPLRWYCRQPWTVVVIFYHYQQHHHQHHHHRYYQHPYLVQADSMRLFLILQDGKKSLIQIHKQEYQFTSAPFH